MASIVVTRIATASALISSAWFVDAACDASLGQPTISWDVDMDRLSVTSGCATFADLVTARTDSNGNQMGPVYHFDQTTRWYTDIYTGYYYLEADLYVTDGATLSIDGADYGNSPCQRLFVASNSSTFKHIRAHGGNLDIRDTVIVSWDLLAVDFDTNVDDGRSHISAITEKITGRVEDTCPNDTGDMKGNAKRTWGTRTWIFYARRSHEDLGYHGPEAYGLSYKARGLCNDHSNLDIYDDDNGLNVGVTGDIIESRLHHNWFGHYSWGHDGGVWRNNKVYSNHAYGFDPHDDSDNLQILDNEVYDNGWHGIIASKRCNNVTIAGNTVNNNGLHGIMLHRSSNYGTVIGNNVFDNGDSGVALMESSYNTVTDNTLTNNLYGIRLSNGANNNQIYGNTITSGPNSEYAIHTFKSSDAPEAAGNNDGYVRYNDIYENVIYSDQEDVWRIKEADSNIFKFNIINSGSYASFNDALNNEVTENAFPAGFYFKTNADVCYRGGSQATPLC